ncbi:sigma-70 family RNA polymerase sigma factor [Kitasatospora sp. NPDC048365]|uniref:sigma-70 family RNA polymerase sigma factor n=1 Tax=Kitasatospora sp. NPDC048365 TaxID=3364050 RepID=UPI003717128C
MLTGNQREAAPDTVHLVHAAQNGDDRALNQLLAAHLPLIYNVVGRSVRPADVDDLVQETMLRAVRGLPTLREPDRFRSWLVAIAYRQLQEHGRRRIVETPHHYEVLDVPDPATDFAERSVAELVLSAQRRDLVRAGQWLEPADRQLLALWWQEVSGLLTRAELADALGIDQPHTAVRLKRTKAQLEAARTVVAALDAVPRCAALAELVHDWDGTTTGSVLRKRLIRHTRACEACGARANGLVAPERLLPGLGLLLVPDHLADRLTSLAAGGGRRVLGSRVPGGRAVAGATAGAVAVVVAVVLALTPWSGPAPSQPGAAAPTASAGPSTAPATAVTGTPSSVGAPPAPPSPSGSPAPAAAPAGLAVADLYVAPDGSDTGDGSLARPYATLGRAAAVVRPGQSIALRGGTYRMAAPVTITTAGTDAQRITLSNYRDERPVLDASALPATAWAVTQTGGYWTVQGLELRGSASHAYVCSGCRSTVFRRLAFHDNARSGLLLRDAGTSGNAVLDSDFYANRDPAGGAGIGLGLTFGSGEGNVVRGCRFFRNATDGLDLGGFTSPVTVDSNWSYRNGNGFTLGGGNGRAAVTHLVRNNAAWDNTGLGFNDEGNPGAIRLTGNTAYRNGLVGFFLPDAAAVTSSDIAAANGRDADLGPAVRSTGDTWGVGADTFTATDPASAEGPRPPAGGLPVTSFLTTRTGRGATMTERTDQ